MAITAHRGVVLAFLQELLSWHRQFPSPESQMQCFILRRWFNVFLSPHQAGRSACLQPLSAFPWPPSSLGYAKPLGFGRTIAWQHHCLLPLTLLWAISLRQ